MVVNFLKPNAAKTFDEYAMKISLPHVQGQLQHASLADVVWDQYGPVRRPEILRVDANKAELFTCLAVHLIHLETE